MLYFFIFLAAACAIVLIYGAVRFFRLTVNFKRTAAELASARELIARQNAENRAAENADSESVNVTEASDTEAMILSAPSDSETVLDSKADDVNMSKITDDRDSNDGQCVGRGIPDAPPSDFIAFTSARQGCRALQNDFPVAVNCNADIGANCDYAEITSQAENDENNDIGDDFVNDVNSGDTNSDIGEGSDSEATNITNDSVSTDMSVIERSDSEAMNFTEDSDSDDMNGAESSDPETMNIAVDLNVYATDTSEKKQYVPPDVVGKFKGMRLLVAEDIEIIRESIYEMLEPTGAAPDFAHNGREAFEMYAKDPAAYDLILMDLNMPNVNGHEAAMMIRMYNAGVDKAVPIIAMTMDAARPSLETLKGSGMNDFIGKPINPVELYEKLAKYIPAGS